MAGSQSSQSDDGSLSAALGWPRGGQERGRGGDAQGVPQVAREGGGRQVTLGRKFSKKKTRKRRKFEREDHFHGDTQQAVKNEG